MKRDMKLVRLVMEFVEEHGSMRFKGKIPIEGYERDEITFHLQILASAGYVMLGQETLTNMGPLMLTWKGYDYIDELRRES